MVYEHQNRFAKASDKLFDEFLHSYETKDNTKMAYSFILFYELLGNLWGSETLFIESLKEGIDVLK